MQVLFLALFLAISSPVFSQMGIPGMFEGAHGPSFQMHHGLGDSLSEGFGPHQGMSGPSLADILGGGGGGGGSSPMMLGDHSALSSGLPHFGSSGISSMLGGLPGGMHGFSAPPMHAFGGSPLSPFRGPGGPGGPGHYGRGGPVPSRPSYPGSGSGGSSGGFGGFTIQGIGLPGEGSFGSGGLNLGRFVSLFQGLGRR